MDEEVVDEFDDDVSTPFGANKENKQLDREVLILAFSLSFWQSSMHAFSCSSFWLIDNHFLSCMKVKIRERELLKVQREIDEHTSRAQALAQHIKSVQQELQYAQVLSRCSMSEEVYHFSSYSSDWWCSCWLACLCIVWRDCTMRGNAKLSLNRTWNHSVAFMFEALFLCLHPDDVLFSWGFCCLCFPPDLC